MSFYVQCAWTLIKHEFPQTEHTQNTENREKFLKEESHLMKEQHFHSVVIKEEDKKCAEPETQKEVNCGTHSCRIDIIHWHALLHQVYTQTYAKL
jgi:hypothetical protein